MSALFHIQAPETDAHYLSSTGVWFNEKKREEEGDKKDDYSRNCETGVFLLHYFFLNYHVHRMLRNPK